MKKTTIDEYVSVFHIHFDLQKIAVTKTSSILCTLFHLLMSLTAYCKSFQPSEALKCIMCDLSPLNRADAIFLSTNIVCPSFNLRVKNTPLTLRALKAYYYAYSKRAPSAEEVSIRIQAH